MSVQGNSRSNRRSSSKAMLDHDRNVSSLGNSGRDKSSPSQSTSVGISDSRPCLEGGLDSSCDHIPTKPPSMNLRRSKPDTDTRDHGHGRSPEFKMQLRHKQKPADSMDWQFTPSPPSRENNKVSRHDHASGERLPNKIMKDNSASLSDPDEFFNPFKSSPSDDIPGKSDESSDSVQVMFQHQQSANTENPTNVSSFLRSTLSSYEFPGNGNDDTLSAVSNLPNASPYSSGIQQPFHHNQKALDSWQEHDNHWSHSPPSRISLKEEVSPMVKTGSMTLFASPPPKKRRYLSTDNADLSSESGSKSANVFRSPAASQWLFTKSPLFSKDTDGHFPGMSFGLDTPGRSKFDDLLQQTSFDAMPYPVHGEDSQSPFKGMSSQSALDFASKFGLSQSYSIDEGIDSNVMGGQKPPLIGHHISTTRPQLVSSMSPYRHKKSGQYLPSVSNQRLESVESFPSDFMSPPHQPTNFQHNHQIPLPHFPPSKKTHTSPESSDTPNYGNVYRPMIGHSHFIPQSNDQPQRKGNPGDNDVFSPGPFRVKIGNVGGLQQAEARRGMEGINTIMKEVSSQSSQSSKSGVFSPIIKGVPTPSTTSSIRQDIRTPMKAYPPIGGSISSGGFMGSYPNTGSSTTIRSFSSIQTPRYPKFHSPSPHLSSSTKAIKDSCKSPGSTERNPCNCKKCKCLKLYCECFAADLYCEGCNCNDCNNTSSYDTIRDKAKQDTIAKNPNAFKKKITESDTPMSSTASPQQIHNMGCRCKKSSCLMKYCECFQSNIFCGGKCKCSSCKNFHGSQALIDRRRKIKDNRGAEKALRPSDELWQTSSVFLDNSIMTATKPSVPSQSLSVSQRFLTPGSIPSYSSLNNPSSQLGSLVTPVQGTHPFIPQKSSGRVAPMTYTSGGMKPAHATDYRGPYSQALGKGSLPATFKPPNQSPHLTTPRTPKKRRCFDFNPEKREDLDQPCSLFGSNVTICKGIALQIFSFLPNDAIYNASLVSREWNKISLDEELWQY